MRTKTVLRYYCDHCSRGMFKKPSMSRHEVACTRNPKRACPICRDAGLDRDYPALVKALLARPDVHNAENNTGEELIMVHDKAAIEWLMNKCGGCPACALAVIQQAKVYAFGDFDYKELMTKWYAEEAREFRDMVM